MSEVALLKTTQDLDLGRIETLSVVSDKGVNRRDELLLEAENVEQITTEKSQQVAANVLSDVSAFLSSVEQQRVALKAPYLSIGRKIDTDIGALIKKLTEEKERIKGLLKAHQIKLEREAVAEQERQNQEIAKLEAQRETATAQQAAVIDQKIGNAMTPVEVTRPKGVAVTAMRKFRVVDIHKLYAARQDLCDVAARTAAINAIIRLPGNEKLTIPGLEIFDDVDVRASSR